MSIVGLLLLPSCHREEWSQLNPQEAFEDALKYNQTGKYSLSDSIGRRLLSYKDTSGDNKAAAYGYLCLSLYEEKGNHQQKKKYAEKALSLALTIDDDLLTARCYNINAGYAVVKDFDYAKGISFLLKAKSHVKRAEDENLSMIIDTNLSEVYANLGDSLGLRYSQELLTEAEKKKNPTQLAAATKHIILQMLEDTLSTYKTRYYLQKLDTVGGPYFAEQLWSRYYIAADSLDQAQRHIERALKDSISGPEALLCKAIVFHRKHKWEESNEILLRLDTLLQGPSYDIRNIERMELLSCNYAALNQHDSAYLWVSRLLPARKALDDQKKKIRIDELRTQYELDKKENEIMVQKTRMENRTIVFSSIILAILLVFFGYMAYQRRRNRLQSIIIERQKDCAKLIEKNSASISGDVSSSGLSESTANIIWEKIGREVDKEFYLDINLTRESVSALIGFNHTWVTEVIKLKTNKTFPQFISGLRIMKACKLLEDDADTLTLEMVAERSGFVSRATFYKAFRETMGMTPAQYRARTKHLK